MVLSQKSLLTVQIYTRSAWQLVSVLLVATTANLCQGQTSEDAALALNARQPYPWPAPVDSHSPGWSQTPAGQVDALSRVPGQWQQRQLAQLEASRTAYGKPPANNATLQSNDADGSKTTRRYFPWPSSIGPNWLKKSKETNPPADPFLRQVAHQSEDLRGSALAAGPASTYPQTEATAQYPGSTTSYPAEPPRRPSTDSYRTARGVSSDRYADERPPYSPPTTQTNRPDPRAARRANAPPYGPPSNEPYGTPRPPENRQPAPPRYEQTERTVQQRPPTAPAADLFEPARIVAMVGDQPILAGDMLGQINEILKGYLESVPESERHRITEEELQTQRMRLVQQMLPQMVDLKLQYLDFVRQIPPERFGEIQGRIEQSFHDEQLQDLVKKAKLTSPKELDAKLRSLGSSVAHQKRLFLLQVLAGQARNQNLSIDEVVSPDEMLAQYREHLQDYEYPAKVRWERLMVRFDKFESKDEAWNKITEMGNRVVHGAPLSAVAKKDSQGSRAADGGLHDWTTQGSLVSKVLDEALFTLPVNELSKRLEDERGFYIVRVIERQDAGRISFVDAQAKIEEKIKNDRRAAKKKEYIARLREQTRVWTIFDDEQVSAEERTATEPQRRGGRGYR